MANTKQKKKTIRKVILIWALLFISICLYKNIPANCYPVKEADQTDLPKILKKCVEYCEKLDNSVLYFVCQERVEEEVYRRGSDPRRMTYNTIKSDVRDRYYGIMDWRDKKRKIKKKVSVYEYQLIRKDNKIKEIRQLIEEDGKKKKKKYTELKNLRFEHKNIVMGPIGLLSEFWQHYHDYKIVKEGKFNGEEVIILEASPKPEYKLIHLFGKVWVRKTDYSVLKIEWNQNAIKGYEILKEIAKANQLKPSYKLTSEYGFEKNGIRFPSKYTLEETYVGAKNKKFTNSKKRVTYNNYKFFTVETEVKY